MTLALPAPLVFSFDFFAPREFQSSLFIAPLLISTALCTVYNISSTTALPLCRSWEKEEGSTSRSVKSLAWGISRVLET